MMWQAVLLGIVQGITEFLPVSSSGHLILVPELFGAQSFGLAFDVMVHVGTFFAVLAVFWKDVVAMAKGILGTGKAEDRQLGWMVLAATVPVVIVGLVLSDLIDQVLRSPVIVAVGLIVWGLVLALVDRVNRRRAEHIDRVTRVGWRRALLVGCAQVLALVPGTSRSGITMTAGLALGLSRSVAARFSFLLSLPAIGGAAVYVVLQALQEGVALWTPVMLTGLAVAFVSGLAAIRFLLRVVERWSYLPFAVYRVALGVLVLILFL